MRLPPWLISRAWMIAPLAACGFLLWTSSVRIRHVEYLATLGEPGELTIDPASPTGYADGIRAFVAQEHNKDSYEWIAQTQQMLASGQWRVRHVDYDNAPTGREVHSAALYRWWLMMVAWVHNLFSDGPLALSIERAALFADPALHLVFLIVTTVFTARWFGTFPAALLAVAIAAIFPLGGAFLAAQPDDFGLTLMLALWSVLPLVAGANKASDASRTNRLYLVGGVCGGLGLWANANAQSAIILGILLGGLAAAWQSRSAASAPRPWRIWAIAGAVTSLAAYVFEYLFAGLLSLRVEVNHPLYALAWIAAGEVIARLTAWRRRESRTWRERDFLIACAALLLLLVLPAALIWRASEGLSVIDLYAGRVTNLPGATAAENLREWYARDGFSAMFVATLLPLGLLIVVGRLLIRGALRAEQKTALLLGLGPVVVGMLFACVLLRWWSLVDAGLLALLVSTVAIAPGSAPLGRWLWTAAVVVAVVPGIAQLRPRGDPESRTSVTNAEIAGLFERHLAHWLARQAGPDGAVVLAPPESTASLCFHGGLRGLGTPYWENRDGFTVSVRIAGATSADEGEALIRRREVTHIVLPSWDGFMDEYARLATGQPDSSLVSMLKRWLPPRWLRPVAYHAPEIEGTDEQHAVIFTIVDVQDNATALSRLAEYFVEMKQLEPAQALAEALEQSFGTDLSALAARAQVAIALRDGPMAASAMDAILPALTRGDDQELAWDRRVSLVFVLMQARRPDLARQQLQRCVEEIDEIRLRALSTVALVNLMAGCKFLGVEIPDPELVVLARKLLPAEIGARL